MYASAFVLGFHGCDEAVGERVLAGKDHLHRSANKYDWLGHGVYFWENSPQRAAEWARFIKTRPELFRSRIERPFVVGAIIDLGECLDLTEASSLGMVKTAHAEFKAAFELAGFPLPVNQPGGKGDEDLVKRHLDCAVINYVHDLRRKRRRPRFDTVRGAFFEGKPLYDGAKIMAKTHIQLCVRSRSSILGYFRPMNMDPL
ncbi:MAG: hypothetical protein ABSA05_11955 [Opitutaceae bacterium]|jgi:hypothetical protein